MHLLVSLSVVPRCSAAATGLLSGSQCFAVLQRTRLPLFIPQCLLYPNPRNHASPTVSAQVAVLVLMHNQLHSLPSQATAFCTAVLSHKGVLFFRGLREGLEFLQRRPRAAVRRVKGCPARCDADTPKLRLAEACPEGNGEGELAAAPATELAAQRTARANPTWPRRRRGRLRSFLCSRRYGTCARRPRCSSASCRAAGRCIADCTAGGVG